MAHYHFAVLTDRPDAADQDGPIARSLRHRRSRRDRREGPLADADGLTPSAWLRGRIVADRVVAAAVAVLTAPVVIVLAVLIRRADGDPPLIRVRRVGRNGTPFGMWKLRSMRAASPQGLAAGSALTNGTDDERITPIGRRIRSYHLDELPQLWNVAMGDMSLLGPRPETPEFVDLHDARWLEVLSVPPGIAGPTQLIVGDWEREVISASTDGSGYRSAVLPAKLAIDRWYLHAASPTTDLLVAGTLMRRFLPGNEAWTLRHRVFADVPAAAPAHAFLRAHQAARSASRASVGPASAGAPPWSRWRERLAHELDARVARRTAADPMLAVKPMAHRRVWVAQMDGEVVLYDAAHGLAHHLSVEAAIVWQRCDGTATVAAMAAELADALGVEPEQMLRDVTTVVLQLIEAGALVDSDADAAGTSVVRSGVVAIGCGEPPARPTVCDADPSTDRAGAHVTRTFDALGYRFRLRVDDARVARPLEVGLASFAVDSEPDHEYVIGAAQHDDKAHLWRDGEHLETFGPTDDVLGTVFWHINQHAIAATRFLAVHAAAVEIDGGIIVMPGAAGAGKTTVAAALVADGFDYVTEEVVALDTATGEIAPFPWPFRLEVGSQPLFAHLQPEPGEQIPPGNTWFVHPDQVRPDSASSGGTARAVVVPAYRPGAELLLETLTPAKTLLTLLSAAMNLDAIGHDGFLRLVDLAWSVPGYRLEYGDLADARPVIGAIGSGDGPGQSVASTGGAAFPD